MSALVDTEVGRAFAARFGQDQAEALAGAAMEHADDETHANHGSDPFRWVLAICIGYECYLIDRYRKHHGVTAPAEEVDEWVRTEAHLELHDGDVDYISLFAGAYNPYVPGAAS